MNAESGSRIRKMGCRRADGIVPRNHFGLSNPSTKRQIPACARIERPRISIAVTRSSTDLLRHRRVQRVQKVDRRRSTDTAHVSHHFPLHDEDLPYCTATFPVAGAPRQSIAPVSNTPAGGSTHPTPVACPKASASDQQSDRGVRPAPRTRRPHPQRIDGGGRTLIANQPDRPAAESTMPARSSSASTRIRSMSRSRPAVFFPRSCGTSNISQACINRWSYATRFAS
jgi:hypothetical protein